MVVLKMLVLDICLLCEALVNRRNLGIYDIKDEKWFDVSGDSYSKVSFHRQLVDVRRDEFEFAYHDDRFVTRYSTYRVVGINKLEYDVYFVIGTGNEQSLAPLYEHCVRELVEQEYQVNLSVLVVGEGDHSYDFVLPKDLRRFWNIVK